MTTMKADGSNKTVLGLGLFGVPSEALHGGHRWFVYATAVTDETYPNGTRRREVLALRDDYHYADNNNASTRIQLTSDLTLEPTGAEWVAADGQVSFIGRRWSSADPGATVVEGGIYTAPIAFDANGNVVGLAAQPAQAVPLPLVEPTPGDVRPDIAYYSWDRSGAMVTYSDHADGQLWVADLIGSRLPIFTGAHMPKWSPLGDKIVFTRGGSNSGIWTIKPNGSGLRRVIASTSTLFFNHAHWSADGQYLVFIGQSRTENNMDLYRTTATGAGLTQLTSTPPPFTEQITEGQGGWR